MYQDIKNLTKILSSEIFINDEKQTVFCKVETVLGTFGGKATCSPQDTFNAAVGKKIAYNRALRQANSHAKVVIRDIFIKPAETVIAELQARMDNSAAIIETELNKLND